MEQEVTEQARGVIIGATTLAKLEGGLQQRPLRRGQGGLRDLGLGEPVGEGRYFRGHGGPSLADDDSNRDSVERRS